MRQGPAGDFDYEQAPAYASRRRTDPRIASLVHGALNGCRSVLNVGAGAGSYEPAERYVVAVEPSPGMRAQRPPSIAPALDATAEALPFDDDSFDAAMAMITLHQWPDWAAGLREMWRVSRDVVLVLTFDGDALERLWLGDYVPELYEAERRRYPAISDICSILGPATRIIDVPVPGDCLDGFTEAFYGRPEEFLDPLVRASQSAWAFVATDVVQRGIDALRADLASGEWDRRYGHLRRQPELVGALRLLVSRRPPGRAAG